MKKIYTKINEFNIYNQSLSEDEMLEKRLATWATAKPAVAAPWLLLFNGVSKKYDLADTLQMILG